MITPLLPWDTDADSASRRPPSEPDWFERLLNEPLAVGPQSQLPSHRYAAKRKRQEEQTPVTGEPVGKRVADSASVRRQVPLPQPVPQSLSFALPSARWGSGRVTPASASSNVDSRWGAGALSVTATRRTPQSSATATATTPEQREPRAPLQPSRPASPAPREPPRRADRRCDRDRPQQRYAPARCHRAYLFSNSRNSWTVALSYFDVEVDRPMLHGGLPQLCASSTAGN